MLAYYLVGNLVKDLFSNSFITFKLFNFVWEALGLNSGRFADLCGNIEPYRLLNRRVCGLL
jgi:hypothetical protein